MLVVLVLLSLGMNKRLPSCSEAGFLVSGSLEWSPTFCVGVSFWEKDAELSPISKMSLNPNVNPLVSLSQGNLGTS